MEGRRGGPAGHQYLKSSAGDRSDRVHDLHGLVRCRRGGEAVALQAHVPQEVHSPVARQP
ncbi:hypothetical protein MUK42_32764 [Musa troglodytarum]|uniref:Uncharacterized protein n=1 Tax=Musa troglodytarum TaxID=320322 RepID=A0A9E7F632_9LILI|nr:hypothetical protein MUK42_32764 [Musa troglodytarum]